MTFAACISLVTETRLFHVTQFQLESLDEITREWKCIRCHIMGAKFHKDALKQLKAFVESAMIPEHLVDNKNVWDVVTIPINRTIGTRSEKFSIRGGISGRDATHLIREMYESEGERYDEEYYYDSEGKLQLDTGRELRVPSLV